MLAGLNRGENFSHGLLPRKAGQAAYWTALALIFGWAAWLRFRLPLDPIAVPDYLLPALKELTGLGFGHIALGRTMIYPGFIYLVLRIVADFRAITVIQHFVGLLAGGVFLLTWQQLRDFIPDSRLPYSIYRCLGLIAAAIYLFASEPLHFEMSIRPEGIYGFLISINLYFVAQFTRCGCLQRCRTATVPCGIAVVFSSILLGLVKPSFWLTAVVALLPVAAFLFRRGSLRQKILVGSGAAAGAALLLLPEQFFTRNNEVHECFLPTQLFVIHANLIRDQMAHDLRCNAKIPYPRDWLGHIDGALNEEIAKSFAAWPGHYRTLGFDPDYLMYNPASIAARLNKEFGGNHSKLCAFYWFYYWRIWLHRPFVVANKILREMAIFYAPECPAYRLRKFLSLTTEYSRAVKSLGTEAYRKISAVYSPAVDFMSRATILARNAPFLRQRLFVRRLLGILAATYLPLLLIALGLSVPVLLHEETRRRLGRLAAAVLFIYAYNAASCLEVAIVHSLDNPRYLTIQMYVTILAQFLAFLFVIEMLLATWAPTGRERHS